MGTGSLVLVQGSLITGRGGPFVHMAHRKLECACAVNARAPWSAFLYAPVFIEILLEIM